MTESLNIYNQSVASIIKIIDIDIIPTAIAEARKGKFSMIWNRPGDMEDDSFNELVKMLKVNNKIKFQVSVEKRNWSSGGDNRDHNDWCCYLCMCCCVCDCRCGMIISLRLSWYHVYSTSSPEYQTMEK